MNISSYRHPVLFYFLSTATSWFFWFIAAYLSHITPDSKALVYAGGALGLLGLISPMAVAYIMMRTDPELRHDLFNRIFSLKSVPARYALTASFLMLGSILLAQAISLLFGHSADQFALADGASFTYGLFPAWFLLFLAPLFEELAWHSYGTDCLHARFSLFTTSILFGIFWVMWHVPLGLIKGYYHSNVVETGWLYSLNFAVSLFPFVIIMNWLYYKTGRNILITIVFHITAGLFNETFATHPDSKVIQTVLLLGLSAYLLISNRQLFFGRPGAGYPVTRDEVVIESPDLRDTGEASVCMTR